MSFIGRSALVFFSLVCLGCNSDKSEITVLTKHNCTSQQGVWIDARYGEGQTGYCISRTADAGKVCHSNQECQSACVIDDQIRSGEKATGQCFSWSKLTGHCVNRLDNDGLAEGTVCYD